MSPNKQKNFINVYFKNYCDKTHDFTILFTFQYTMRELNDYGDFLSE